MFTLRVVWPTREAIVTVDMEPSLGPGALTEDELTTREHGVFVPYYVADDLDQLHAFLRERTQSSDELDCYCAEGTYTRLLILLGHDVAPADPIRVELPARA